MCILNPLARILETLEILGTAGRHDLLVMAALETHGYFRQPERANNWDTQMFEIKAHDIFATGADLPEVIRNWMLAAGRQSRVQQQVDRAEYLLRQPGRNISADQLRAACQTIITESRVETMRLAARTTLADLDATA